MANSPDEFVAVARKTLEAARNPEKAAPMAAYMKHHFLYLGLPRPAYQALVKPHLKEVKGKVDEAWILEASQKLWQLPEREYQYLASNLLADNLKALSLGAINAVRELVITKSWWDSVDSLSGSVVAPLVTAFPELKTEMDEWAYSMRCG